MCYAGRYVTKQAKRSAPLMFPETLASLRQKFITIKQVYRYLIEQD